MNNIQTNFSKNMDHNVGGAFEKFLIKEAIRKRGRNTKQMNLVCHKIFKLL